MSGSYYVDSSNRWNVNELLDQAELYRDQALQYSNDAAASATDADSSEANALSIANNAAASASAASTSQANAASSASAAASSAANASSFSRSASSFATAAGVARDAAVVAKNDAQTAATNAAASATQANNVLSSSLLKANNLSDLVNASTARSNLGLGTAATKNAQTSSTDTTAGALMAVGAFGLGSRLDLRNTVFEVGSPADVFGKGMVTGLARGGPDGLAIPAITRNDVYGILTAYGHWGDTSGAASAAWREFRTGDSLSRVYHQCQTGGTWQAWQELWNAGNLPVTTFAKTLLDDADAAAARGTLDVYSKAEANGIAIGVGQTWHDVTASRAAGTTYTNTTGRTIAVSAYVNDSAGSGNISILVGGRTLGVVSHGSADYGYMTLSAIVPPGGTYSITTNRAFVSWEELR